MFLVRVVVPTSKSHSEIQDGFFVSCKNATEQRNVVTEN